MKKLIAFIFLFSVGAEAKTFKIDYVQEGNIAGSLVGYESETQETAAQEIINVIPNITSISVQEIEPIVIGE